MAPCSHSSQSTKQRTQRTVAKIKHQKTLRRFSQKIFGSNLGCTSQEESKINEWWSAYGYGNAKQ